jgi:uncharacterized protein (PEP-CTERM system associated)
MGVEALLKRRAVRNGIGSAPCALLPRKKFNPFSRSTPGFVAGIRPLLVIAALCPVGTACAESWTIKPLVSLSETYSTNVGLTSGPTVEGWISDLAPGIFIDGQGPRIKAHLDYGLHVLRYNGLPARDQHLNSLVSGAEVEAVQNWLFVDADANIMQRNRDPFTATAADASSATANRSETTTMRLSPYIKGDVANLAAYQVRFATIYAKSDDESIASTHVDQWSASLNNFSGGAKLGWSLDGNTASTRNEVIGDKKDDRLSGRLIFEVPEDVHLSFSDGKERTNYTSVEEQTAATPGWGIEWAPDIRTQAAFQQEKRYFGTAHNLLVNHRGALIDLSYTDVKDVAILPTLLAASGQGTISDLMSDLLTASIPDPAARAAAVRSRLNQDAAVFNQAGDDNIQTSRFFIHHAREAAFAWITPRNTLTLKVSDRKQQVIGEAAVLPNNTDLVDNLHEINGTLSWDHRLTPRTSLNIIGSRRRSTGLTDSDLRAYQTTQTAAILYRISLKTFASLGVRSLKFDSTINGAFKEKAIAFSLTRTF